MALVRICGCGHANPATEAFCVACNSTLANVSPEEAGQMQRPLLPCEPSQSHATAAHPATVREACIGARLSFDWGEEPIGDVLVIGRDLSTSSFAARLQPFGTVSGWHAELRPVREGVQVRHLSNTNPTYIDGKPLATGEIAIAQDGARIDFSRTLTCILKVGAK